MSADRRNTRRESFGFAIGIAAERVGMHPQTLREYERQGLVQPERTPGGARRYRDEQLHRLQRIQQLTTEGLNLAGVRKVLILEDRIRELASRADSLEQQLIASGHAPRAERNRLVTRSMSLEIVHVPRARRSPRWRNED
jgi:MerR family transcriptional regulator/heat shock protein HspR